MTSEQPTAPDESQVLLQSQALARASLDAANAQIEESNAAHDKWLTKVLPASVDKSRSRVKGGKGYFLSDNTASGGERIELGSLTCAHCNRVVYIKPGTDEIVHWQQVRNTETGEVVASRAMPSGKAGFCSKCHARLCDEKICNKVCSPVLQQVEMAVDNPAFGGVIFTKPLREHLPELFGKKHY